MKKEWLLLVATVIVTIMLAIGLIRLFVPQLLGIPVDLQMVQLEKTLPPFYDGVFRHPDPDETGFLLKDPVTSVRNRPFLVSRQGLAGPHDILGFRNRQVPNVADIVIIGDSQTYGTNVILSANWPSQMRHTLKKKYARKPVVYAMATGGWGAIQYLDMADKAMAFKPRILVVAFYSGNDPLESFLLAYNTQQWQWLIPDHSITASDAPTFAFPAPESEWWPVEFSDGTKTIFTPYLRHGANDGNLAANAGYAIMEKVARLISEKAAQNGVHTVFTIIPTKELVYAEKVRQDNLDVPDKYLALIRDEEKNIHQLASTLAQLPNTSYVDVTSALQEAAMDARPLYPQNINGHPITAGYRVIGETVSTTINPHLPPKPAPGLVALSQENGTYEPILITEKGWWHFISMEILHANNWKLNKETRVPAFGDRDIADLEYLGVIDRIAPAEFGPHN